MKKDKYGFDLTTPADFLDYDPLKMNKDIDVAITKNKGKPKPAIDYKDIKRDYIKTDRSIIDVVIPFLIDKYNAGTAVLYVMLYRLSYGFRKNKLVIDDDLLAKRTSIPKRTLCKYRINLEECGLIYYTRGYKSRRKPQYTILLPEQAEAFVTIYTKTANKLPKEVKSLVSNTIYKDINNYTKEVEDIVRSFYIKIGKTDYQLTRKQLDDGIKTIQTLIVEKYSIKDIQGCIEYTLLNKPDTYSISMLNYTMGSYLSTKDKIKSKAAVLVVEDKKRNDRNKKLALERHLIDLFKELPQSRQNTMMLEVEANAHKYMEDNKLKFGETFIVDSFLMEMLEEHFSDVVVSW